MTKIMYLIDPTTKEFFFFEEGPGYYAAKEKQKEYGTETVLGSEVPIVRIQYRKVSSYYGTVWVAYDYTHDAYIIAGRYKDVKRHLVNGYKIKKYVVTPYEQYIHRFEEAITE